MRRMLLVAALAAAAPAASRAQQLQKLCIDFSQSAQVFEGPTDACGPYVNPVDPGPQDAYAVQFAVPHGAASKAQLYYTADGTDPTGALGIPSGTTQVLAAALGCTYGWSTLSDVFAASIPAFPENSKVTFRLSATDAAGQEYFLGSGDGSCSCAVDTCGLKLSYTVGAATPRPVDDVFMVAQDTPRTIPAPGVMKNDRYVNENATAVLTDTSANLKLAEDGSLTYTPSPGFVGDDVVSYQLQAGQVTSGTAAITFRVRPAPALAAVSKVSSAEGCPGSAERIARGLDDGANGGVPLDGVLQDGEVADVTYLCASAAGGQGAAALIRITNEPAGANCATGGQKVEAGVDANGDAVLADSEVTSQSFVCDGAKGKSGCSAAPDSASFLGAIGALISLGAMRRRSASRAGAAPSSTRGGEKR